ncbi:hypothetical protein L3049_16510 [Labilibaculum sp. DW002]|uniref:Uncharacterized protein n=1 Tax=Paralabilibaculum antarcticum TaxID=2912572 RepID=A0ABT5VWG2_9BACT|nr:hypothetical protein [Labilibaculum sp. DW002]MDE5419595.1 hypothetical protein [Labilibaculum sp. DW002]
MFILLIKLFIPFLVFLHFQQLYLILISDFTFFSLLLFYTSVWFVQQSEELKQHSEELEHHSDLLVQHYEELEHHSDLLVHHSEELEHCPIC